MDEYLQMIEDCQKRESRLTDWERDFIQSMSEWADKGRSFTPKQQELIDGIWETATAKG